MIALEPGHEIGLIEIFVQNLLDMAKIKMLITVLKTLDRRDSCADGQIRPTKAPLIFPTQQIAFSRLAWAIY